LVLQRDNGLLVLLPYAAIPSPYSQVVKGVEHSARSWGRVEFLARTSTVLLTGASGRAHNDRTRIRADIGYATRAASDAASYRAETPTAVSADDGKHQRRQFENRINAGVCAAPSITERSNANSRHS